MELRGGFDVAQHGANINRFAEVAAQIFAESLHGKNFSQRFADAKKILKKFLCSQFSIGFDFYRGGD